MLSTSARALLLILLPLIFQLTSYSLSRKGYERQHICQKIGIFYLTMGITSLVRRDPFFSFLGLLLLMLGLFLVAKGLDRKDKKMFIDRYEG